MAKSTDRLDIKNKYRVILIKNGKYVKTFFRSNVRKSVFERYHKLLEESDKVINPKTHINCFGIIPCEYKLVVTKVPGDDDEIRYLRDKLGRTYSEELLFGIWNVIADSVYNVEEEYFMFGCKDSKRDRHTTIGVLNKISNNGYENTNTKMVIVVNNKLLIYNEDVFDMVICKNLENAQRLHHILQKLSKKKGVKGLMFLGTCKPDNKSKFFDLIVEKTGWKRSRVSRISTRP